MKGDFSRSSFNPSKHYTSVRMQQGRVHLDADWNEQADILAHAHCTQLRDLVGKMGGRPAEEPGFVLTLPPSTTSAQTGTPPSAAPLPDLQISAGHRYVDGILCINEQPCALRRQPDFPGIDQHLPALHEQQRYLFYLDVWEHHVSAFEDPDLRELALVGPDSTTRTKTVWQVKGWPVPTDLALNGESVAWWPPLWDAFRQAVIQESGRLKARKHPDGVILQNQLYRVEIHSNSPTAPTFKWSRENGTIAYGIKQIKRDGNSDTAFLIQLEAPFGDQFALQNDDLVEICSDEATLNGAAGIMGQLKLDPQIAPMVRVTTAESLLPADKNCVTPKRTVLRRWDHQDALPLQPGDWLTLEDGLQIQFANTGGYRIGDYWLIPVRANPDEQGGSVLWPDEQVQPPHGTEHHYAPLALLYQASGQWELSEPPAVAFAALPQLTDQVEQLAQRMTAAEKAIASLRSEHDALVERVDKLEQRVERIEAYWAEERTQLYQDLAAHESLEEPLEAGTVVALCADHPNQVEKAQLANATLLYGVVKEQGSDGRYRVVMQGRVQCQVVDEVAPGDLLVPSGYPGRARKAGLFVQPGTLLGRALSARRYEPGTDFGVVDALITLS